MIDTRTWSTTLLAYVFSEFFHSITLYNDCIMPLFLLASDINIYVSTTIYWISWMWIIKATCSSIVFGSANSTTLDRRIDSKKNGFLFKHFNKVIPYFYSSTKWISSCILLNEVFSMAWVENIFLNTHFLIRVFENSKTFGRRGNMSLYYFFTSNWLEGLNWQ